MSQRGKMPETPGPLPIATDSILESISDGVFTVDGEWRVSSFNRAAEQITGIPRDGRHRPALLRRVSRQHVRDRVRLAAHHGHRRGRREQERRSSSTADGQRIPISVSTALLRDEHGDGRGRRRDLPRSEPHRGAAQGDHGPLPGRGHRQPQRVHAPGARRAPAHRREREHDPAPGRDRHRQGAGGTGHPRARARDATARSWP